MSSGDSTTHGSSTVQHSDGEGVDAKASISKGVQRRIDAYTSN